MVRIHPYPPFYAPDGQPLPIEKWPTVGKRGTRIRNKLIAWVNHGLTSTPKTGIL